MIISNKTNNSDKYYCSNPWTSLFIWGNGDVTHCCYSNIGPIGIINNKKWDEIWTDKKLQYIRNQIRNGNYIKAGCEHFCRAYRWSKYYGKEKNKIDIPEGLGRDEKFDSFELAKKHIEQSIIIYNTKRPHLSCSMLTPAEMYQQNFLPVKYWKKTSLLRREVH